MMMIRKKIIESILFVGVAGMMLMSSACKKLIEIDRPNGNIGTESVFETDDKAAAAMAGVYSNMINNKELPHTFYNSSFDIYGLLLSDDGYLHAKTEDNPLLHFYDGHLKGDDVLSPDLWTSAYRVLYSANAVLEGIQGSSSTLLSQAARNRLTGQALFCRAYSFFNLVNSFGDVPLITTTDVTKTMAAGKTPSQTVYKQIIDDLKKAFELMPAEPAGLKTHPDKYAAAALLARVCLFQKDWVNAAAMADSVINSGEFALQPLNKVFRAGSKEGIWMLHQGTTDLTLLSERFFVPFMNILNPDMKAALEDPSMFAMIDQLGYVFPSVGLSQSLMDSFEPNDQRKQTWTSYVPVPNVEPYDGVPVYYSIKVLATDPLGNPQDLDVMLLRLAETYLNRAEANAHNNKLAAAIADVNIIRSRAGLPDLQAGSQEEVLQAIAKERRVELFAECGHRWFDLKRTGKASATLGALDYKQPWSDHTLVLPIPMMDLLNNPAIKQNEGY